MLLKSYDQQGLLFITSVLGATSTAGISAFRGDLVLKTGAYREGSTTDRKPPELLLHQAAVIADEEKLLFVSGLLTHLQDVATFVEKYHAALTAETLTLFFVENIAAPMQVILNGCLFKFLPYKEGMVWNETLDLLYLEKADLKDLSAEDKVAKVFAEANSYKLKADTISFESALTQTIVVKKAASVGPV